jgi:glutathione peroxidase
LEEKFSGQGLHVLGFLSNDFGNQGGSDEQIHACNEQYAVTFEQFDLDHVKDPDGDGPGVAQPVFAWLAAQPNPGPAATPAPTWNFHKYLVSRDGQLVAHWPEYTYPGDDPNNPNDSFETNPIVVAIQAELAKPP